MTGGTPYLATDTGRSPSGSSRSSRISRSRACTTGRCCTASSTDASCWPAFALLLLESALRLTRLQRMP